MNLSGSTIVSYVALLTFLLAPGAYFAQQNINGSFAYNGNNRTYILHIPPTYTGITTVPLVLNLHGFGSTAGQQQFYAMFDAVSDTAGFIVVYPNAINSVWDTLWSSSPVDDIGFISALLDTVSENYQIDSLRIYATGLSMGGFMTYRLGSELAERIAAIASVAGPVTQEILDAFDTTPPIPVMHIHGTADSTIPYNGLDYWPAVESVIQCLVNKNNCSAQADSIELPDINASDSCTVVKYNYGSCDDSTEVIFYKILNGGHTWPGGLLNIPNLGNTNRDLMASEEIWNFFRKHELRQNTTSIINSGYENEMTIFPNPSNGIFTLRAQDPECNIDDWKIRISNAVGQEIDRSVVNHDSGSGNTPMTIDLSTHPQGIYIVKVQCKEQVFVQKLILQ